MNRMKKTTLFTVAILLFVLFAFSVSVSAQTASATPDPAFQPASQSATQPGTTSTQQSGDPAFRPAQGPGVASATSPNCCCVTCSTNYQPNPSRGSGRRQQSSRDSSSSTNASTVTSEQGDRIEKGIGELKEGQKELKQGQKEIKDKQDETLAKLGLIERTAAAGCAAAGINYLDYRVPFWILLVIGLLTLGGVIWLLLRGRDRDIVYTDTRRRGVYRDQCPPEPASSRVRRTVVSETVHRRDDQCHGNCSGNCDLEFNQEITVQGNQGNSPMVIKNSLRHGPSSPRTASRVTAAPATGS
jgi:hypothetical protein